jgi:transcription-repair coupling factor (superfamily II helicase)
VLIPEEYVQDLDLRLGLYRRAGKLHMEEEIDEFGDELIDRFGPLPQEVEYFLLTLKLKRQCMVMGVERVDVGPKGMVITFYNNKVHNPEGLVDFLSDPRMRAKLRADQKLVLPFEEQNPNARLKIIQTRLEKLQEKLTPMMQAA